MKDYIGCWDCIYNENQIWELTYDFTQVYHHNPNPSNIDDIRDHETECESFKLEE